MDLMKMVYVIIGITISVIIAANVLLPVILDLTNPTTGILKDEAMWTTLIILTGTLTIIAIVMMAVRAMGRSSD